jgi:hypothetical protein
MSRANDSVEVLVHGPGEIVLGLADRSGRMLLLRRIAFSGHKQLVARSQLPLRLETLAGCVEVSPLVVSQSRGQVIRLDGRDAATFIKERCRSIGAVPSDLHRAARGAGLGTGEGALKLPARADGLPHSMRPKRGPRSRPKKR